MPDAGRHARVKDLFLRACDLDPAGRAAWLADACGRDEALRREVEAMLGFEVRRPGFLHRLADVLPDGGPFLGHAYAGEADDAPLPPTIGPFRVLRRLGTGGMGTVYEVEQERPRRTVALKLLHPGLTPTAALRRFEQEGEILGRLQHPGIARIYESGRIETAAGPQPYLAMEYVRGEPLTRHARTQLATPRERMRLFARVCDAVQHAHEQGIVHRDLKPANVLVEASGQPKVLDFGIARVTDGDVQLTTLHTGVGEIVGTLAYMSPEQASGDPRAIDARSDVYSLGVLMYEMLAGELPYDVSKGSLPHAIDCIRHTEPRRLSTVHRVFGGDVETIVGKALEKDRQRRYVSAAALAADVRRHLADEPIEARPPSRAYRARKFVRRHRTLVAASVLVLLSLVAGLVVSVRFGMREAEQRRLAERSTAAARAESYASGMLAAQLMVERGDISSVLAQLESVPEEHRGWEWGALARRADRTLDGLPVPAVAHAAYADGEHVVHVDECGAVGVWDLVTGADTDLGRPAPGARPLALSDDGRWLLSHADGALLLGELPLGLAGDRAATPRPDPLRIPLPGRQPAATWWCAAIGPDARMLALATLDGSVQLVEPADPPVVTELIDHTSRVNALRFSPDGRYLMVAGSARAQLFDLGPRALLWSRYVKRFRFDSAAFDMAQGRVAMGAGLGVDFHDLPTGEVLETWNAQKLETSRQGSPFRLEYDPSRRRLAALFRGSSLWILDAASGEVDATARPDIGWMATDMAWARDGASILTCGRAGEALRLWNGEFGSSDVMEPTGLAHYGMALSPDGALVAAGAWDGNTHVWDVATGDEIARLHSGGQVWSVAFSPDGRRLACGLRRGGLAVWDARTGAQLHRERQPRARCVTYTPDGSRLVIGSFEGKVEILDADTFAPVTSLVADDEDVHAVACSPDGRLLAVGAARGGVSLWALATGAEVARTDGPQGGAQGYQGTLSLAFSPDGDRLAIGSGVAALTSLDVPSLTPVHRFVGHHEEVFGVAFTPDGRRLVSGGRDRRLRVWNPETGGLLVSLEGHDSYIWGVAITPDGRRIATSAGDGTVRVWDSAPASVGWKERRLARRDRRAAGPLVERALAEAGDASRAAERLATDTTISASMRRQALSLLLQRSAQAEADAAEASRAARGAGALTAADDGHTDLEDVSADADVLADEEVVAADEQ